MSDSAPESNLTLVQFEKLYKDHFRHLCNFADQYVFDSEISKDIVQKVFISLWEKRSNVQVATLRSYLFTAVKNRCLNYIRDHKKYRSRVLDLECGDIEIAQGEDPMQLEELQDLIDDALKSLPDKCRVVFEMSRFEDKKYKVIAMELDISEKTVEAHMSKALRTLRSRLSKYLVYVLLIGLTTIKCWIE
ncbi:MAG: RNA polymerase sigma-70 factor [Saprospiraceae bacterium]|nr:RNA polymerase sigma-70 factor [Saprospiraceae bacterium]